MPGILYRYNGSSWDAVVGGTPIYQSSSAPSSPSVGDIWVDTGTSFAQGTLLKAETVVSGSAVTSVTFSGLDSSTDGGYVLSIQAINALSSGVTMHLYINGDTTDGNYYRQYIYADSTTISAGRNNYPRVAYMVANKTVQLNVNISCINNIAAFETVCSDDNGSALNFNLIYGEKTTSTSNITSLTITAGTSSAIGVGSIFRLYKRK